MYKWSLQNLKSNLLLLVSGVAFSCLNYQCREGYYLGIVIAVILMTIIAGVKPDIFKNNKCKKYQVLSVLTACGIAICTSVLFVRMMRDYPRLDAITSKLAINKDILIFPAAIVGGLFSLLFVFTLLNIFYNLFMDDILNIFLRLTKTEKIFMGILMGLGMLYIIVVYSQTAAFYGIAAEEDIIYNSDSGTIFWRNSFLWLASGQNDLRQPLFALFSAPLFGIFYLVSLPFMPFVQNADAYFMAFAGWAIALLTFIMISELLELTGWKRISFIATMTTLYPTLLFGIMMEQYLVGTFWLLFFLYMTHCKKDNRGAFIGAVGTLMTNALFVPLLRDGNGKWNWKTFIRTFLIGLFCILIFSRFDVIYHLLDKVNLINNFSGKSLEFTDKVKQYLEFVCYCIFSPHANGIDVGWMSWRLDVPETYNVMGIVILVLVIISGIWNRKNKAVQFAFVWVLFSVGLLLLFGYGTNENGLVLYSYYFSWAFWVLLYMLCNKVLTLVRKESWVSCVCFGGALAILLININGIVDMVKFAVKYYPLQ